MKEKSRKLEVLPRHIMTNSHCTLRMYVRTITVCVNRVKEFETTTDYLVKTIHIDRMEDMIVTAHVRKVDSEDIIHKTEAHAAFAATP